MFICMYTGICVDTYMYNVYANVHVYCRVLNPKAVQQTHHEHPFPIHVATEYT